MSSRWCRAPDVRLVLATAVTGVLAGLAGIALTLLLHAVQHAAFGYTEEAFLTGVERASAARRVIAMAVGGAVVGTGWWALWRYSRRFPAVGDALTGPDNRLPLPTVTADAALQIIAVGFGASLGGWRRSYDWMRVSAGRCWPAAPAPDWPRCTTSRWVGPCSPSRCYWCPPPPGTWSRRS